MGMVLEEHNRVRGGAWSVCASVGAVGALRVASVGAVRGANQQQGVAEAAASRRSQQRDRDA